MGESMLPRLSAYRGGGFMESIGYFIIWVILVLLAVRVIEKYL